jgi:two-component system response regulator FlrC
MNTHAGLGQTNAFDPVAVADSTRCMLELARKVAHSDCTVLVTGESGVGKEVLARFIHRHSQRPNGTLVAVNCAAIPEPMLEATLFGWERGAFTGAHAAHAGKFEQAQGGTLLLDEITEMPLALQAKLLRVLQEREVERLGSDRTIKLDVRVITTSNRNLRNEVTSGRFREDLYYRINVFPLQLAPLRERPEDLLPLAMRLLASHSSRGGTIPALSADAAQALLLHSWPGNVRELDNVMQRALVLCEGGTITPTHISYEAGISVAAAMATPPVVVTPAFTPAPASSVGAPGLARSLLVAECQIIIDALRSNAGSRERVARRLGISPRTLRYKLARMRAAGLELQLPLGSAA